jgi:hypothetical protein
MKRQTGRVSAALAWLVATAAVSFCVTAPLGAQPLEPLDQDVRAPYVFDFETIEQGEISYFCYNDMSFTGADLLIKDKWTWAWFWAEHTKGREPRPPLPEVNFGAEMVIVTILGFQTTGGGPRIEVLEVETGSRSLHVLVEDDETAGPWDINTNPFHIIRLQTVCMPSAVFEHRTP